jgi:molybdate transport system regulatory protein
MEAPGKGTAAETSLRVKSKVWIEIGGRPFFGEGRRDLLACIDREGSISRAAKLVGISYKKAWSYIKSMEERWGKQLVRKQVGGKGGGGALLTDEGRGLIARYDRLLAGTQESIDQNFRSIF